MIITIDTSKDSKKDLLAAARMLSQLAGKHMSESSVPMESSDISEESASAFGAMFGDDTPTSYGSSSDSIEPKDDDDEGNDSIPPSDVEIMTY